MVEFSDVELVVKRDAFNREWRRVEPYISRRPLTKDLQLIDEYKNYLVETYNDIAIYLGQFYVGDDFDLRIKCVQLIQPFADKLRKAFEILGFQYPFSSNNFELIDINLITEIQAETNDSNQLDSTNNSTEINDSVAQNDSNNSQYFDVSHSDDNDSHVLNDSFEIDLPFHDLTEEQFQQFVEYNTFNNIQAVTMVQSAADFLKLAGTLINYKYEGDPLKLKTFLADVDLVNAAAEAANKALCITFIKRCLTGRALECITDDDNTIELIKTALDDNIKPESADVVEGKMMALRVRKGNFTEFTQEAERLAEAFRRSLVVSGIPRAKAQELTIKKTIELCRKTARLDTVKSVISSTKYEQPADVLATLVTQNDIARKEKAESDAIKAKQQSKNSGSQNRNGRFNGRGGGRGNYNNNGGRGGNNFRQQNGNRDQQQQRGNGNFRGNGQNRPYQNRGGRPEHTIRLVTGNQPGPSHGQMFYPQQQMLQQPQQQQPQQDQIFQIPY